MKPQLLAKSNKSLHFSTNEKTTCFNNRVVESYINASPVKSCNKNLIQKDLLKKNSITYDENISTGTNTFSEFGALDKKMISNLRNQAINLNKDKKSSFKTSNKSKYLEIKIKLPPKSLAKNDKPIAFDREIISELRKNNKEQKNFKVLKNRNSNSYNFNIVSNNIASKSNISNSCLIDSKPKSVNSNTSKICLKKYPMSLNKQEENLKLNNLLDEEIKINQKLNNQEEKINNLLSLEGNNFNNNNKTSRFSEFHCSSVDNTIINTPYCNIAKIIQNKASNNSSNENNNNKTINIKSYSINFNKGLTNLSTNNYKYSTLSNTLEKVDNKTTSLIEIESDYSNIKSLYNKVKVERESLKKNTSYIINRVSTIEAKSNETSLREILTKNTNDKMRKHSIDNSDYKSKIRQELSIQKSKQQYYSTYLHDSVIESKKSAREISNPEMLQISKRKYYEQIKKENLELKKYKVKKSDELSNYILSISSIIKDEKTRALNKKIQFLINKKQSIGKSFINDIKEIIKNKKEILQNNSTIYKDYEGKLKNRSREITDESISNNFKKKCNFNSNTLDQVNQINVIKINFDDNSKTKIITNKISSTG